MKAKVSWKKGMQFVGQSDSGYPVWMDGNPSPETGAGPVEILAIALAGCTGMDVISILQKKQQKITSFAVSLEAERAKDHPQVIIKVVMEYVFTGHSIQPEAVRRAIELSVTKYCPVFAMLGKAFPIDTIFTIYENEQDGDKLVEKGIYPGNFE